MDWCPIKSVFLPHARCSMDRIWIHYDPDQNKAATKVGEWMSEWYLSCKFQHACNYFLFNDLFTIYLFHAKHFAHAILAHSAIHTVTWWPQLFFPHWEKENKLYCSIITFQISFFNLAMPTILFYIELYGKNKWWELTFAVFATSSKLVVMSAATLEVGRRELYTLLFTASITNSTGEHSWEAQSESYTQRLSNNAQLFR